MPIPEALQGNDWTKITARNSLPLLVWCAQHGRTITYGHLDRELIRRGLGHHVHAAVYGYPAGAIGSALIETEQETGLIIPPLNALVVNKSSGLPGNGCDYFLDHYVRDGRNQNLTAADRKAIAEQVQEDAFNYQDWDDILNLYEMTPIVDDIPLETEEDDIEFIPPTRGWSSEEESEEHRALKNYILNNPQVILGSRRGWTGTIEFPLPSGDYVDVFFKGHGRKVAVEVKSIISNDQDISRGLFQCIKYRAVTRAWQRTLQEIPNGNSVLVVQRELPRNLKYTANMLAIDVVVIQHL